MQSIRYTLKNDFFDIPFLDDYNKGINLDSLPSCGFKLKDGGDYLLFLSNGKKIFNRIDGISLPPNTKLFYDFARSHEFPVIMNFLEGDTHRRVKRDFDLFLKHLMPDFSLFLESNVSAFFRDQLKGQVNLDLYGAVLKLVIDVQFKFFFSYELSEEQLYALCYFDDYFSFGSYINSKNELFDYYSFVDFTYCFEIYKKIRDQIFDNSRDSRFIRFASDLYNRGYLEEEIFDQFYNVALGGGSTNVSKMFVYLNNLIEEEELFDLVQVASGISNLAFRNSGLFLKELYRFLPFVKNQVVPPYVMRVIESNFCLGDADTICKGNNLYFYNSLENISDNISEPLRFNPVRDYDLLEKSAYKSFGSGRHFCCGIDIANVWLHQLIYNLFKHGLTVRSLRGLEHSVYNNKFVEIKRLSYIASIK